MKIHHVKTIIGILFIMAQAACPMYTFSQMNRNLEEAEAWDIILITGPLFAVYASAVIVFLLSNRVYKQDESKANTGFIFITFFYPAVYLFVTFYLLYSYTNQSPTFSDFETFKKWLGGVEAVFGVGFGLVMKRLYNA